MTLDRLRLHEALSPFSGYHTSNIHVWGQESKGLFKLDSLMINRLGTAEVPFKSETVANMRKKFKMSDSKGSNYCEVPAGNIYIPNEPVVKENLRCLTAKAIKEKFGINEENLRTDIDVSLKSLVICEPTETFEEIITQKTHHGTFGTLYLQLPLDSDPSAGASVKTLLWHQTTHYKYTKKSPFHLTFVAGNINAVYYTKVTVQPIKRTPVAFLVFRLVWLDSLKLARVLKPAAYPDFLVKTHQATQALSGWREHQKKIEDGKNSQTKKKSLENIKIPLLKAKKVKALCIPLRHNYCSFDYRTDNLKKHDVLTERILNAIPDIDVNLVIVKVENRTQPAESMVFDEVLSEEETVENPSEMDDQTSEEGDDDVNMVSAESSDEKEGSITEEVVPSPEEVKGSPPTSVSVQHNDENNISSDSSDDEASSISSELERRRKKETVKPIIDWKNEAAGGDNRTISVHRWIYGDWLFADNFQKKLINLRANRYLVGDVTSFIEDEPFGAEPDRKHAKESSGAYEESSNKTSYHPAIIIRPRKAAIADSWEFSPVRTLQSLTRRLYSSLDQIDRGKESERHVLLQDVVLIFDLAKERGCKLSDCQTTAILHQLLYICTRLKAIDKGLEIMEMIPQRQCKCAEDHKAGFETFISESGICEIEDVVVDFVAHAGWEKCAGIVLAMFSRHRRRDYPSLSYLSSRLIFNGWTEPGVIFAKLALKAFAKQEKDFELDPDKIIEYLNLAESVDQQSRLEIYERLGEVAAKNTFTLHIMIDRFFANLNDDGEKLEDLKSSLTRILGKVNVCDESDVFMCENEIMSALCFLHHTQNAELLDQLWTKVLQSTNVEDNATGVFEDLLRSDDPWIDNNNRRILYNMIGAFPVARKRFYKFIEYEKAKFSESRRLYSLGSSFFHLTMAELEPDLADTEELQSFCSAFKGMSTEWLTSVVEAIVRHNKDNRWVPPISQSICSALLECLPTQDLSNLITQENEDFYNVIGCYIKLGSRALKLKLIKILKETFLNGNQEDFGAKTKATTALLNTWLTCLKTKLRDDESNHSTIVYQIFNFLKFYLNANEVKPDEATAENFSGLSQLLTFEFLENFLPALLKREQKRSPICLKDVSWQWNVCQALCDMYATHPKMKKEFLKFEPDRTVEVARCIFWLGSQVSNERFSHLVCSTPFTTANDVIVSNGELKQFANSSTFAFTAFQKMVRHEIDSLFFDAGSLSAWERPNAIVADHPEVEEFYRSNQRSKSFGPFERMSEAKRFGESAIDGLQWAEFAISKTGSSFCCEITKLYPEFLDADHASSLLSMSLSVMHRLNEELVPQFSCVQEVSKFHKCFICITTLLSR